MAALAQVPEWADAPIDVNAIQQFSEFQFQSRTAINASTGDPRKQIPPPFTRDNEIDWTPAWSLITARRRLVPLNYCYSDAPCTGDAFCIYNPNGSAAETTTDKPNLPLPRPVPTLPSNCGCLISRTC
jgi:ribosomal protein S12 methylthiotransferase accessory factor